MREGAVAALRDLVAELAADVVDNGEPSPFIDWDELFNATHGEQDWIAWPLIPCGRQAVVYAPAKAGKSLLVLDMAASVASGRPILGNPNVAGKRHVLYLDYEMTGADLVERLQEMGYEPEDLGFLHYALLPIIPALNTAEGAKTVRQMAQMCEAELVIIDTLSRAVEGDINAPGTVSDFYRWTGVALKADGRALIRLDHEGKDAAKGMIGSSMKATDVDIVWHLKRTDDGLKLTRKHTRITWGPDEIDVTVQKEPLRHTIAPRGWAAGTNRVVEILDRLGLADDCSCRAARSAVKGAGETAGTDAIQDACRKRRERVTAVTVWCTGVPGGAPSENGARYGTPVQNGTDPLTRAVHPTVRDGARQPSPAPPAPLSIERCADETNSLKDF